VTATTRYRRIFTAQRTTILDARRMTMNELATALQSTMDAPVVNRTGLSGGYEFKRRPWHGWNSAGAVL
jgi:uncharacterized protein (TIGR03435 family)